MLTREGCLARQARLWSVLPDSVEWVLVADPRHVNYFSNFWVQPLSFSDGERALLLLEREGESTLFGDNFTLRSADGGHFATREVVERWYDHQHSVINRDHALLNALKLAADRLYGRCGAVEAEWLPLGVFEILGLDHEVHSLTREPGESVSPSGVADVGSLIRELRRRKQPDEIELLKQCMRATEAGHARALEVIQPGVSEFDIYREVQAAALAAAGRPGLVYGDFRAVNAQSPKAGGLPTGYQLQAGDLFILDYSVVLHGYRSDFTNTYAVSEPTEEQTMLFRLLESALAKGQAALRAGVRAADVYAIVSQPLEEAGYGPLAHHAGHGIGLAHPEPPILVPHSADLLEAGDVVTLEPGLYIEGVAGMRIENNYLITDSGAEQLSHHAIALG